MSYLKLDDRLAGRRTRVALQLGAATVVLIAIALAFVEGTIARVVASLLFGTVVLVALKVGLVGLVEARQARSVTPAQTPLETEPAWSELKTRFDRSEATLEELAGKVKTESDAAALLGRRTEPALAELATLRQEVTYLREVIAHGRFNRDL